MRNLIVTPAQQATLRACPARLPGVEMPRNPDEPTLATLAALTMVRHYWRLSQLESEIQRSYSLIDYSDTPMTERAA